MLPELPVTTYRGDRYRTNFTAGLVLELVHRNEMVDADMLAAAVSRCNEAGVPGGKYAGSQWTPPAKEGVDDTLRRFATRYYESSAAQLQIVKGLVYSGLLVETRTPLGAWAVALSDMGRKVYVYAVNHEATKRAESTGPTLVQSYYEAHELDTAADALEPETIASVPFGLTQAVAAAYAWRQHEEGKAKVPGAAAAPVTAPPTEAGLFEAATKMGVERPDVTVDPMVPTEALLDQNLPVRRSLLKKPTYRQLLWAVRGDYRSVLLSLCGHTDDVVRLVLGGALSDLVPETPVEEKVKGLYGALMGVRKFADIVLRGGPEGVWDGKPLSPSDVHHDVQSFVVARRAGFDKDVEMQSSQAWELYSSMRMTMQDLEESRNLLERTGSATPVSSSAEVQRYESAYLRTRNSTSILSEMGFDVELSDLPPLSLRAQRALAAGKPLVCGVKGCDHRSVPGAAYCERHGGSYLDPDETSALVRVNQQKIIGSGGKAVETLIDLMLHSNNDGVRLQASKELLDRGGMTVQKDIKVSLEAAAPPSTGIDEGQGAAVLVRQRLSELAKNAPKPKADYEGDVIDAEVEETV